jgi:hypothetical protein
LVNTHKQVPLYETLRRGGAAAHQAFSIGARAFIPGAPLILPEFPGSMVHYDVFLRVLRQQSLVQQA